MKAGKLKVTETEWRWKNIFSHLTRLISGVHKLPTLCR